MSQILKFDVTSRDKTGSNAMRKLRADGLIPAVLYGHGQTPAQLALDARSFERALQRHARFFELANGSSTETAIIRETQWDTFGMHVMHVDFLRVNMDEKVEMEVPVELVGIPKGVTEGGVLEHHMAEIRLLCAPRNLPDVIKINVTTLGLHQSIQIKDVPLPEGASHAEDLDRAVATVATRKIETVAAAPAEAGAAEPEVVGAKAKADDAKAADGKPEGKGKE